MAEKMVIDRIKDPDLESLEETALIDFLRDESQSMSDKFELLLHIVQQLKAIDQNGCVLLDLHGGNIFVLSSKQPFSVRFHNTSILSGQNQIDFTVPAGESESISASVPRGEKDTISPWNVVVTRLAILAEVIGEVHHDHNVLELFRFFCYELPKSEYSLEAIQRTLIFALELPYRTANLIETYQTDIKDSSGHDVVVLHYESLNPDKSVNWVLLTAVANGKPIGFIDIEYFPFVYLAELESTHWRTSGITVFPYQQIRLPEVCGVDGFFVLTQERARGVGNALFGKVLEILRRKGCQYFEVKSGKKAQGFYQSHGGKGAGYTFSF